MWRKCDLHIHTTPNEQAPEQPLDAVDLVRRCLDRGLSVVAITDHDHARNVEAVVAAAGYKLLVVAGIEVTTDHGHLLVLAPSADGSAVIQELVSRTGISEGSQRSFNEIVQIVSQEAGPTTGLFRDSVVLIGAHVDLPGSLLGPQPLAAAGQLELAEKLHALEVVSQERVAERNRSGVQQSGRRMPLIRGSDAHTVSIEDRFVHLYLPAVDHRSPYHAHATFDGPARAIRCAVEIAERMRELGIDIRAGVHTGECELIDGKAAGVTVSIGARVAAKAAPSEFVVSQTVKDLVAGSGFSIEDRDDHELKGVPDHWRLYRVRTSDPR